MNWTWFWQRLCTSPWHRYHACVWLRRCLRVKVKATALWTCTCGKGTGNRLWLLKTSGGRLYSSSDILFCMVCVLFILKLTSTLPRRINLVSWLDESILRGLYLVQHVTSKDTLECYQYKITSIMAYAEKLHTHTQANVVGILFIFRLVTDWYYHTYCFAVVNW